MFAFGLFRRLHWLTWLVFLSEGSVLAYFFLVEASVFISGQVYYTRGAPLDHIGRSGTLEYVRGGALLFDIVFWFAFAIGPALLCEAWSRRRFQFSMSALLIMPILLAAGLCSTNFRSLLRELPELFARKPVWTAEFLAGWISLGSWLVIAIRVAKNGVTRLYRYFGAMLVRYRKPAEQEEERERRPQSKV